MSMTENPVHPGEVLNALFLAPPEMSAGALAGRLSADTAPRPSAFLATPLSSG